MDKLCSIIIRTHNEERWIGACLSSVFKQQYCNFEVVLVDNESTDRTLEKAKQFPIEKIVTCPDYLPGKALNMGIRASKGGYIVCLSGHCIPVNEKWLSNLLRNFSDPRVAGVYGRQEPLAFTPDADKRDLCTIFGLDRKIQQKDSFFHNANSMIRKDIWDKCPFDENVTNIEDRVWAHKILKQGYCIIYEPEASVYHYHGIYQNGDTERCVNTVNIIENLVSERKEPFPSLNPSDLEIICFIPLRGAVVYLDNRPLLDYTVKYALSSKYIKQVIVTTDDQKIADLAVQCGADVPFLRDKSLSEDYIDLERVICYSLEKIEEKKIFPDLLISMEVTFPFRPKGLIDGIIEELVKNGFDTMIAGRVENKSIWMRTGGKINKLAEGLIPRKYKDPTYIGLRGVCCATHPENLRMGNIYGQKVGIYEVNNPYAWIEVRSDEDIKMAEVLMSRWENMNHK